MENKLLDSACCHIEGFATLPKSDKRINVLWHSALLFWVLILSFLDSSSALFQHITALIECSVAAIVTLLVSDPMGSLHIRSCKVMMLSDWYTMLYNPSPDYVTTIHCTHEAVYPLWVYTYNLRTDLILWTKVKTFSL